ncbi:hypothetical protein BO83DRAFT_389637 [Aspergillus eucalypticola CBS 122712]|uniref:Uncharacterized protein n=1 Tax=Aspergillus eucalypticola (strain CBS 122712 / IBT 29274) TaxID=1448314 RepID=A0A317VAU8_ASPEC|nr:uncharacterized protein BO83DRAFT_389637 [Aspergillus eucalypticola CBS 122712]PWY71336.1 hypothetical protein BO83DRAFT_389637 [Aspergillus eucalypticola CBS 122712]
MAGVTTGSADQTLPGFGDTGRLIDDIVGDYEDAKEQGIRCGKQGFPSAQPYLSHTPGAHRYSPHDQDASLGGRLRLRSYPKEEEEKESRRIIDNARSHGHRYAASM